MNKKETTRTDMIGRIDEFASQPQKQNGIISKHFSIKLESLEKEKRSKENHTANFLSHICGNCCPEGA